jgi:hypothetical protein
MSYDAPLKVMVAVADASLSCRQHITYKCKGSGLWPDSPYGWWNDRRGNKVGPTWCQGNCECDKNDYVWREDSGHIKDKSRLPIDSLNFGDTGDSGEEAKVAVGSLECTGDITKAPKSCSAIPGSHSGRVDTTLVISGKAVSVVCDFNSKKVELKHNLMSYKHQIGVESPQSGTVSVSYAGGIDAANEFVAAFSGCTQRMDYKCKGSGVWNSDSTPYNAFRNSKGDLVRMPCGGSAGGTCHECDKNDYTWRHESGTFTGGQVPIEYFKYGDTGDSGEENQIKLGPISCSM